MIFQGIRTSFAKKPYIFCDSSGGGGGLDPLSPPLDLHMYGIGPVLYKTVFHETPKISIGQSLKLSNTINLIQLSSFMEQSFTM